VPNIGIDKYKFIISRHKLIATLKVL